MTSSRTRRSAPPTTASAMPRSRMAAAAATRSAAAQGFDGFSDIFSSIFGEFMDPRGQRAERGARRRPALRPRADASRKRSPGSRRRSRSRRWRGATAATAVGLEGRMPRRAPARPAAAPARSARSRASSWSSAAARLAMGSGEMIADPCNACDGEGRALKRRKLRVNIPAGVDEGTRIRVAGEGEAGVRGAQRRRPLSVRPHEAPRDLRARGIDAGRRGPISFTTAALGGTIALPGIDGKRDRDQDPGRHPVGRDSCASAARG